MTKSAPNTTVNILSGNNGSVIAERSILLTGQKNGGTAASGELIENIISEKELNDYFGRNSQVAIAGRALIKELSISSIRPKFNAIGLDDNGSGVDATGSFTITGTATKNGTLTFYIDSLVNGKYEIDVISGETADQIGDKLELAITNNLNAPITAVNTSGVVDLTAVNAGTIGNSIGLKYTGSVNGLTVAKSGLLLSGGATDPVATGIFDIINDIRFTSIIYPREWGISILTDYTESKLNVNNDVLDGAGFVSGVDTYSNIISELDSLNKKTLCYVANKLGTSGVAELENPLVIASQLVALRELRLTINSNLSKIAINGKGLGGSYYGALPYHNTPFFNLGLIDRKNQFTAEEAREINKKGGTILINNNSNNLVIAGEVVTTYKTNVTGDKDLTFKYLNALDSLSLCREYIFNSLKAKYPQHSLTTGRLTGGLPQVNADSFIATLVGFYDTLSGYNNNSEYGLLINSDEIRGLFKREVENSIVLNLATGTITADTRGDIVSQLRNIIINIIPSNN